MKKHNSQSNSANSTMFFMVFALLFSSLRAQPIHSNLVDPQTFASKTQIELVSFQKTQYLPPELSLIAPDHINAIEKTISNHACTLSCNDNNSDFLHIRYNLLPISEFSDKTASYQLHSTLLVRYMKHQSNCEDAPLFC